MEPQEVEKVKERLYPEELRFVLACGFSQVDLLGLVKDLGIVFPGVRPSQLTIAELAEAMADEFYRHPSSASRIGQALDEKLKGDIDLSFLSSRKGLKAFKKSLYDLSPDALAAYLWRLSRKEDPETRKALTAALDVLDERMGELEKEGTKEVLADLLRRSGEATDLEENLREVEKSNKQLKTQVLELERRLSENRIKLQQREEELEGASRKIRRIQVDAERQRQLEEKCGDLERMRAELFSARSEMDRLRRELAAAQEKLARYRRLKRVGLFVDLQNLAATAHEKVHLKNRLQELGYCVRARPILYRADGTAKGDWDMGMAVDVLERADRLDIVVLGTGDGDFLDLVHHLKEKKTHLRVEIICFDSPRHTSERLLLAVDHVHRLGAKHILDRKETTSTHQS